MTAAAVGLGSNLGNRRRNLAGAVEALRRLGELTAVSSLYQTAPIGGPAQDDFANAVVLLETSRAPRGLLDGLLAIERAAGRVRRERWGPRVLDLDLLLHGHQEIQEPGLVVPHPRLAERRFALEPLLEVLPEAEMPDGTPLADLLGPTLGQEVRKIAGQGWWHLESTSLS